MKPTLILWLSLFSIPLFSQNLPPQYSIYFDYGKSDIRETEYKTLNTLLDSLKHIPHFHLKLSGNTDADGSNSFNQNLSENRIRAIKAFLMEKGSVSDTLIQAVAWGEMKPISDNQTDLGKQQNRRVDIYIHRVTPSVVEKIYPFDKDKRYAISRLFKELETPIQEFQVEAGKEQIIVGKKGTLIKIPSNAFDVSVKIKLKEAYTYGDMIAENLTTISNKDILETDGMVYIEATHEGKTVKPKENLFLMMPRMLSGGRTDNKDPYNDMQLFVGNRAPKTNSMNWTLPKVPKFAFYFQSFNPQGQLSQLKKELEQLTDTCNCDKMFLWQIDSFYVRKAIREHRDLALTEKSIIKDSKPANYEFVRVNTEGGLSKECFKIAAWAAPDNSWHRKVSWKLKHQIFYPDWYRTYRAANYNAFVNTLKDNIRLCEEAIRVMDKNVSKNGYMAFETKELNWINCDRFSGFPESELATLETDAGTAPNISAKIIFPRLKSVMEAHDKKGVISFSKIPKNEDAVIVAMKIEEGKSLYALHRTKVEAKRIKLKFEEMTPEEIAQKIKDL